MKSNAIVVISIIGFVVLGLFVLGYNTRSSSPQSVQSAETASAGTSAKSPLTASEMLYDFGMISMKNGVVTNDFKVTNSSDKDVTISTLLTSCMCTSALIMGEGSQFKGPFGMAGMGYVPPANELIKAGDSRTIRVVFDPNAHGPAGVGKIDRFVTMTDTSGSTLQLEVKATVTP